MRPTHDRLLSADEGRLFDIMTGFFAARLLAVALKKDLFTQLSRAPMPEADIGAYLGFPARPCRTFLNGLVAVGLLDKAGHTYENAVIAETYLVKGRPEYQGANVRLLESLYEACGHLEEALATDQPTTTNFSYFFGDEAQDSDYAELMHESGVVPSLVLLEYFDFSDCGMVLDVGGGSGRLAATLASQYPDLNITLFDLPRICAKARDYLVPFPTLQSRIAICPADFFRDDFPEGADALVMMRVLHDWPDDTVQLLLNKAYRALKPGGRLLVYETMRASDSQPDETFAIELLMLLISPAGRVRSFAEMTHLMERSRFRNVEVVPTAYLYTLLIGHKPREEE